LDYETERHFAIDFLTGENIKKHMSASRLSVDAYVALGDYYDPDHAISMFDHVWLCDLGHADLSRAKLQEIINKLEIAELIRITAPSIQHKMLPESILNCRIFQYALLIFQYALLIFQYFS